MAMLKRQEYSCTSGRTFTAVEVSPGGKAIARDDRTGRERLHGSYADADLDARTWRDRVQYGEDFHGA